MKYSMRRFFGKRAVLAAGIATATIVPTMPAVVTGQGTFRPVSNPFGLMDKVGGDILNPLGPGRVLDEGIIPPHPPPTDPRSGIHPTPGYEQEKQSACRTLACNVSSRRGIPIKGESQKAKITPQVKREEKRTPNHQPRNHPEWESNYPLQLEKNGHFAMAGTVARKQGLDEIAQRNYAKYHQQVSEMRDIAVSQFRYREAAKICVDGSTYFKKEQQFELAAEYASFAGYLNEKGWPEKGDQLYEKALDRYEKEGKIKKAAHLSYHLLVFRVSQQEMKEEEGAITDQFFSDPTAQRLLERTLRYYAQTNPAQVQLIKYQVGLEDRVPFLEQASNKTSVGFLKKLSGYCRGLFDGYHEAVVDPGATPEMCTAIVEEAIGSTKQPIREAAHEAMERGVLVQKADRTSSPWHVRLLKWFWRDMVSQPQYKGCN